MKRNILAVLMALCMMITALPIDVMAEALQAAGVDAPVTELGADGEGDAPDLADLEDLEDPAEWVSSEPYDVPVSEEAQAELTELPEDDGDTQEKLSGAVQSLPTPADVPTDGPGAPKSDKLKTAEDTDSEPSGAETAEKSGDTPEKKPADAPDVEGSGDEAPKALTEAPADAPEGKSDGKAADAAEESPEGAPEEKPGEAPGEPAEAPEEGAAGKQAAQKEEAGDESANPEDETVEQPAADDGEKDPEEAKDGEDKSAEAEDGKEQPAAADAGEEKPAEAEDGEEKPAEADGEVAASEAGEAPEAEPESADQDPTDSLMEPLAALTLDQTAVTLPIQETCALHATGGTGAITWVSENTGVATVDAQGVVTAVATGSARIVAKDEGSAEAVCDVTVVEVPEDVAFAADSLVIGQKETRKLPGLVWGGGAKAYNGTVTYTSANDARVTVTADGTVRGVKRGSAIITASLPNGKALQCTVTVKKAPTKVKATPKKRSLGVGESLVLTYKLPAGCGGSVAWTSDNPGVVSVNAETGVITALANGTAKVTACTYNNKRADVRVSVFAAPTTVAFDSKIIEVGLGETFALSASVNEGAYSNYSFATENDAVASVLNGRVTGAALGETQVTVTTYNNLKDTATIVVKPAPTSLSLPYKTLNMGKGDRVRLTAELGGGASQLICTSRNRKIVKVTADGMLYGVRKGTAYVTVRTFNNKRAKLKVVVKGAPSRITASPNPLNLGLGETYKLGYKTPSGTAGSVRFTGDAPSVFSVNETTGEITALATGTGTVTLTTYNGRTTTCPVTVYNAPTSIAFDASQTSVAKKQKLQLQMVFNEGSWSNVVFESENPRVAKVSSSGLVTGVAVGQTVIRAKTYVPGLYAETVFTVWGAPSRVWLDKKTMVVNAGESFQLEPRIPVGSKTTYTYKSSNNKVATVSAEGVVQPLKKGKAKITIITHNKKKVTLNLTVVNPGALKLTSEPPVMKAGETWQAQVTDAKGNTDLQLTWTSSNPEVATVDENGLVTAVSYGYTTITVVSVKDPNNTLKIKITVESGELALTIPKRITTIEEIPANLALINAIRSSAISEVKRLQSSGAITSADASKRKSMIENIFENYAFPWMTPGYQKYWKAANSEGGVKDFKPGNVYYGLPYISGSGANRHYNAALALKESRYTDSGSGYYLLNQDKLLNGKYVGNDCSGLVDVSIWGLNSKHSDDRTEDIALDSDYRTIGDATKLRPGDLLCKANAHVVMFLYFANAEKTKIMIIENGGSEAGTNTVHCDVKTLSSYTKNGYKVRRLSSLG